MARMTKDGLMEIDCAGRCALIRHYEDVISYQRDLLAQEQEKTRQLQKTLDTIDISAHNAITKAVVSV